LRSKYERFRLERKRQMVRELAEWIQVQAREHYVPDGPLDHWATLEETLRSDGDDCDGLELLVFHALRDLGFEDHEVYRAIVYRPSDSQHHMVTLWFETPEDPWVIDPTGAMTRDLRRMSQMPEWVPLKVFSDTDEFTVRRASDEDPQLAAK
jgi:predicted transglutaminase-like cysteine proteinase